jgi:hypothetical protein
MGLLDEALSQLLIGRRRPPTTFNDIIAAFGGENSLIARGLNGLPSGRLPGAGTTERQNYDNTMRSLQRYRSGERRPGRKLAELRDLARHYLADESSQRILRDGAWMRLTAEIKVSQTWKTHTMPANAGGRPVYCRLPGPSMTAAITAWMDGDLDDAGDQLLRAFFDQYWGDPEPAQVGRITRVELLDRI